MLARLAQRVGQPLPAQPTRNQDKKGFQGKKEPPLVDAVQHVAKRVDRGFEAVLADPGLRTPDLGRNGITKAFARTVSQGVSDEG